MSQIPTSFLSQCQVTNCTNENFTYCPHCQLYVCINCINKHHNSYKQEYNQLLDKAIEQYEVDQANVMNFKNQKEQIIEIFDREMKRYLQFRYYLNNKQTQSSASIRVQDFQQFQNSIQQHEELNQSFVLLNNQIHSLLNQFTLDQNKVLAKLPLMIDDRTFSDTDQTPVFENDQSDISVTDDNNIVENNFHNEEEPGQLQSETKNQDSNSNPSVFLTRALEHFRVNTCPLITWSFGLSPEKHRVRDIPCTRQVGSSVSLMNHLRHSHCLNYRASIRITRLIASGSQWYGIDLFSNLPTNTPIVNLSVKTYRSKCPLTNYGLYGLTENHQICLCSDETNEIVNLFDHLTTIHHISSYWSTKLVRTLIKGENKIPFPPNISIKNERKKSKKK